MMNAINQLMGGTVLSLALLAGVLTPAYADKISASGKNPPLTTTTVTTNSAVDFGDDSGAWANDGECDDPRFSGAGMAIELVEADLLKDATDCRAAYDAGTVTLKDAGAEPGVAADTPVTPADIAIASPIDAIDFGDDSSEYAKDGECDDPRFAGSAMGDEPLLSNTRKDATDCNAAYGAGTITLSDAAQASAPATPAVGDIDYGDDTSKWAKDEECDDPRFSGTAVAGVLIEEDQGHDATDCRAAVEAGTAVYNGEDIAKAPVEILPFDYGGDHSKWAKDGECDDMRFVGAGVDKKLLSDDTSADATDCQAAVEAGTATIRTVYTPEYAAGAPYDTSAIDFGDNTSDYADDKVCDDPRFEGPGVAGYVTEYDTKHDSADCKAGYEAGQIMLIDTEK